MDSRTTKYSSKEEVSSPKLSSREQRNQQLYKEVSNAELENFDVDNNISVIGSSGSNIDIDKIRDMLDRKYREEPKKKSFNTNATETLPKLNLDETREYDLSSMIEQAKSTKEINYEEDRLRKLHNTEYDILKDLKTKYEKKDQKEEDLLNQANNKSEKKLLDLIDTINAKELINEEDLDDTDAELDPLDLLGDLRGTDDNTKVLGANELEEALNREKKSSQPKKEERRESFDTTNILNEMSRTIKNIEKGAKEAEDIGSTTKILEQADELIKHIEKETSSKNQDSLSLTKTINISKEDFDDFNDIKNDSLLSRILIKLVIFVVILLFVAGLVFLANKFLNLGLF